MIELPCKWLVWLSRWRQARKRVSVLAGAAILVGCAATPTPPAGVVRPAVNTAVPGLVVIPPLTAVPVRLASSRIESAPVPANATASVNGDTVVAAGDLPEGWTPWTIHPSKKRTAYRLETRNSGVALRADADSSASGLITRLSIDPLRQPILRWRWMIDGLVDGADVTDRYAEDAPVRVVLAFDGDKSTLPFRDQMFFEQVKLLSGRDMPYATLMYIWENHKPVDSVIRNPNTDRVRKIVVASGPVGVRQWLVFERNIVDDYWRAYGAAPGRLVAVAILTDTDNTKQRVTAWYRDIESFADPATSVR